MKVEDFKISDLIPYEDNPRHNESAVDAVAASIEEFGFKVPIVIDKDKIVVAGHTRLKAAEKLGLDKVPCIVADDLTEEQIKAFRLADNKVSELASWDFDKLELELSELETYDMSQFGFSRNNEWFDRKERDDDSFQEGNDEYNDFLEKFEAKKTTDDCYTPDGVYEAVADWVAKEYNLDKKNFVRPFYPGGDYKEEKYKKNDVVVDNPPFSILTEICRFYESKGVLYFLFGPTLTLFGSARDCEVCYIPTNASVIYENGAVVDTSFLTNLDKARIRGVPDLFEAVQYASDEYRKELRRELPKYSYPDEVITATMIGKLAKYGQALTIYPKDCCRISQLDSQKDAGKALYGSGFLLSEKAAAEKAAAEKAAAEKAAAEKAAAQVWPLSDREKEIVKSLG